MRLQFFDETYTSGFCLRHWKDHPASCQTNEESAGSFALFSASRMRISPQSPSAGGFFILEPEGTQTGSSLPILLSSSQQCETHTKGAYQGTRNLDVQEQPKHPEWARYNSECIFPPEKFPSRYTYSFFTITATSNVLQVSFHDSVK